MRDDPTRERAERIHADEVERCRQMGAHAVELFPRGARVLTHCNAGALATGGYGTALGAVRAAWEAGRVEHVWVDETRPLLQGGRLTAWELEQLGIPHAVIADSAAASFMGRGEVDLVVTGADRIAANGDTANKIGTYGLAVLADASPDSAGRGRTDVDSRSLAAGRRCDPDRGTRPERGDGAVRRSQSSVRRHAGSRWSARSSPSVEFTGRPTRDAAASARASAMILDDVDRETHEVLERFGFDPARFEELRARVASGELSPASNVVGGKVEPPRDDDVDAAAGAGLGRVDGGEGRGPRCALVPAAWRRSCSPVGWPRASAGS